MEITVETIIDLLLNPCYIQIYVHDVLYEFPVDDIPDEVLYMKVQSMDDPYYSDYSHALCLNIEPEEVEKPIEFHEMYKEYAV